MNQLRDEDSSCKNTDRNQIPKALNPFPFKKMCAHQDDISCLRIGKNHISTAICIRILQSTGHHQKKRCDKGL